MLDANDLLLFAHVVDAGSFSRAAERLGLPKSTVSRRIAALERQLGERLLQRTTRQIQLTELGTGVLAHAREVVAEVDHAQALAAHRQQRPTGRLRVSMPADMASHAFAGALANYAQAYPGVRLEVDLSPRRVDLVGENFDLAIRMGSLAEDASLSARRLALFELGLYAAPAYLARFADLQQPDGLRPMHGLMILPRDGDALPWALSHSGGAGWTGQPETRTCINSPDLLLRLALLGAGVTAITEFFAAPHVQAGQLLRVLPGWCLPPVAAWAVFPGRRLLPARTRLFIEALADALAPRREPDQATVSPASGTSR